MSDDKEEKMSFWTTLPGVLTAIAGIIAAVAALLTALNSAGLLGSKHDSNGGPVDKQTPSAQVHQGPDRDTLQGWMTLVRNHAKSIVACDFAVAVTARFRIVYVFVMMEIGSRKLLHVNVTPQARRPATNSHDASRTLARIPAGLSRNVSLALGKTNLLGMTNFSGFL